MTMQLSFASGLAIAGFCCFVIAAVGWFPKINFIAVGLACCAAAALL